MVGWPTGRFSECSVRSGGDSSSLSSGAQAGALSSMVVLKMHSSCAIPSVHASTTSTHTTNRTSLNLAQIRKYFAWINAGNFCCTGEQLLGHCDPGSRKSS